MPSLADLEYAYLASEGATGRTLADRRLEIYGENEWAYFSALSGLSPATSYSVSDHMLAYYRAQTGLPNAGLSEAMAEFFADPTPPPPPGEVSVSLVATGTDDNSLSSYTFPAQPLGAAAADRLIVVCASSRANNDIDAVSVAGIPAVQVANQYNTSGQSTIWIAEVPTGTTGDIVIQATSGITRCLFSAYRVTGADPTPSSFQITNGNVINTVNGGALIATAVVYYASGESECTWDSITEHADLIADGIVNHSSGFSAPTSTGSPTITASWSLSSDLTYMAAIALSPA